MEPNRISTITHLLNQIGIRSPSEGVILLCNKALTHRSYTGWEDSFERLEFLGDRVLNLVVARFLYDHTGVFSEGKMSRIMEFTKNQHLGSIVPTLGIGFENMDLILRGKGTCLTTRIIASAFEALAGAIYLSYGMRRTHTLLSTLLADELEDFDPNRNFKGILQEYLMKKGEGMPEYHELQVIGPDNNRTFIYQVKAEGMTGMGRGRTKTEAQQMAARIVLSRLGIIQPSLD